DGSGSSRGSGVWICNQCKPEGGSPFDLLMDVCGYSFNEARDKVASLLGLAHGDLVDKVPKPLPPPAPVKEEERDLWRPIVPVPEYALKSMTFRNGFRKSDDLIFKSVFRDSSGAVLGGVARFKKSDGGKIDLPYT
ncbi:DNA primase, partial [Neisseria sp. P0001.S010]